MIDELKTLIEHSGRILVTSHIGPDGDSISSSLLLHKLLAKNFPQKEVAVAMEETAPSLSFIDGYDQIIFQPLAQTLKELQPELVIILDANTIKRITRDPASTRQEFEALSAKLIIIDHHEPAGKDDSAIYINQQSPAVAQDIYELFIEKLKLEKPDGYAQIAMVGIYTDTGGFIHRNLSYQKTFQIVAKLLADGADIELVVNQLSRVSEGALKVLDKLIKNTGSYKGCTYSFVNDDYTDKRVPELNESLREGADIYRNLFLRNLGGRTWGFLVYRDLLASARTYSVSLRAQSDSMDVSKIATALGGGGHKPAAGAKIESANVQEAVEKVKAAIDSLK